MNRKQSRLAGIGILALVMSVTVGLLSGTVADAKKKKGATTFTVSQATPTAIPLAAPTVNGVVKIPIGPLASKKVKGKIVSFKGITVTTTFTGDAGFANSINAVLIGPTGRTTNIGAPFPNVGGISTETSSGPTTETPNSATSVCIPAAAPPPPPCAGNPDQTLGPPYAGTIGNLALLAHSGISPAGTWFLRVTNSSTTKHANLASITINGPLIKSLPTK